MVHKVNIAPLSVNKAWKGRRFKTQDYKKYERDLFLLLPNLTIKDGAPLRLDFEFGFKNKLSDCTNPIKLFEDIISKKYGFNDRYVHEITCKKRITKEPYIKFSISYLELN